MISDFMKHYVAKIQEHEDRSASWNERHEYWRQYHIDNTIEYGQADEA